jgi:hypothetical protein
MICGVAHGGYHNYNIMLPAPRLAAYTGGAAQSFNIG